MNTSVVVSPSRIFPVLSADDLRRRAPSVFAGQAQPGVSARYTFVSTAQVVDLLAAEGWVPVRAEEQRVRRAERVGYQMHEIRFARRSDWEAGTMAVGSTRAELVLQNAHDGSRAYRIDAGLYRLVCRNGLTVADADFAHVSIRHVDVSSEVFAAAAQTVAANVPRMLEVVAQWQAVSLSSAARLEFAQRAAALRWAADGPVAKRIEPAKLLEPVRYGDAAADLWTTFNVIQEHLIRGGDRYVVRGEGFRVRRQRTRPVSGLQEGRALNKALWGLAGEFARN